MHFAGSLVGLAILILDIMAIVDILKSSMDTMRKVLWLIVILVFPLLGLLLYYLFGRKV